MEHTATEELQNAGLLVLTTTEDFMTYNLLKKAEEYLAGRDIKPILANDFPMDFWHTNEQKVLQLFEEWMLREAGRARKRMPVALVMMSGLLFDKLRVMVKQGKLLPFTTLMVSKNDVQELHIDATGRVVPEWPNGLFPSALMLKEIIVDWNE